MFYDGEAGCSYVEPDLSSALGSIHVQEWTASVTLWNECTQRLHYNLFRTQICTGPQLSWSRARLLVVVRLRRSSQAKGIASQVNRAGVLDNSILDLWDFLWHLPPFAGDCLLHSGGPCKLSRSIICCSTPCFTLAHWSDPAISACFLPTAPYSSMRFSSCHARYWGLDRERWELGGDRQTPIVSLEPMQMGSVYAQRAEMILNIFF